MNKRTAMRLALTGLVMAFLFGCATDSTSAVGEDGPAAHLEATLEDLLPPLQEAFLAGLQTTLRDFLRVRARVVGRRQPGAQAS